MLSPTNQQTEARMQRRANITPLQRHPNLSPIPLPQEMHTNDDNSDDQDDSDDQEDSEDDDILPNQPQLPVMNEPTYTARQRESLALQSVTNVVVDYRGPMSFRCTNCQAYMWWNEGKTNTGRTPRNYGTARTPVYQICCGGNLRLRLPVIESNQDILNLTRPHNIHFNSYIRAYNNAFAFTSSSANFDRNLANATHGVFTFRVQGKVHHRTDSGIYPSGETPAEINANASFAQIYILDTEDQVNRRLSICPIFQRDVVELIQSTLTNVNPYVIQMPNINEVQNASSQDFALSITARAGPGQRQYDQPTASEVAAIVPDDPQSTGHRDIVYRKRNQVGMHSSSTGHNLMHFNSRYCITKEKMDGP